MKQDNRAPAAGAIRLAAAVLLPENFLKQVVLHSILLSGATTRHDRTSSSDPSVLALFNKAWAMVDDVLKFFKDKRFKSPIMIPDDMHFIDGKCIDHTDEKHITKNRNGKWFLDTRKVYLKKKKDNEPSGSAGTQQLQCRGRSLKKYIGSTGSHSLSTI